MRNRVLSDVCRRSKAALGWRDRSTGRVSIARRTANPHASGAEAHCVPIAESVPALGGPILGFIEGLDKSQGCVGALHRWALPEEFLKNLRSSPTHVCSRVTYSGGTLGGSGSISDVSVGCNRTRLAFQLSP